MNQLSDEVLLQIFSELDSLDRYGLCSPVCRRWRHILQDRSLWSTLRICSDYPCEKKLLKLTGLPFVKHAVTDIVAANTSFPHGLDLPNLRTLSVKKLDLKDVSALQRLPITKFVVKQIRFPASRHWEDFHAGSLHDFKQFSRKIKGARPNENIQFVIKTLCILPNCNCLTKEILVSKTSFCIVESIRVEHESALDSISGCDTPMDLILSTFRLQQATTPKTELDWTIGCPDYLSSSVNICPVRVTDMSENHFESPKLPLAPPPHLRKLSISANCMNERLFLDVLDTCGSLQTLSLSGCNISRSTLKRIADANPSLRKLSLDFIARSTGPGCAATGPTLVFPRLKALHLDATAAHALNILLADQMGESSQRDSEDEAVPSCPRLQKLVLASLDGFIACRLTVWSETLKELRLTSGVHLNGNATTAPNLETLKRVAESCPNISRLQFSLQEHKNESVDALRIIKTRFVRLERLGLWVLGECFPLERTSLASRMSLALEARACRWHDVVFCKTSQLSPFCTGELAFWIREKGPSRHVIRHP